MTEATTRTIDVPGAVLIYDIRAGSVADKLPLVMVASPMAAAGFTTLAGHFTDRIVVTYDPRQSERSKLTTDADPTPETHADDIHQVIQAAVGPGPVDVLASSGGAVNMLAFVAAHPGVVHTLVAHEPPLVSVLPDRTAALAAVRDVRDTYERDGLGPGMAKFLALIMHSGEVPADWSDRPAPDPAQFGLPTEDDGSRDDPMLGHGHIVNVTGYEPNYAAIKAAPTKVVMAYGIESEGLITQRAALAVADALGVEPTAFPSDHGGFLGGEYGQTGDPDSFAVRLREVLDG
ncbi:alpha/beta hydrolase [Kribbella capetownensis]|uniref:Alpha/beta hydrolase n=1 Tax=Kribbella capetownensis TaxID=1572659 RepID=A0A4R0IXV4_9ACTN|nr:alpha/beta hydrolase [Kribbella capetownensis]TCC37474.1 alpha/beta hydrolase [Kribbella capetownensis]